MSIILCADDFAQNKEISEGILQLASQHRLSAISCLTQMPLWPTLAPRLKPLNDSLKPSFKKIQLGLHFNLTHKTGTQIDSSIHPLFYWMIASLSGWINRQAIEKTFHEQCDAFEGALGQIPDFIDGHQHVHAFPIIREVIIQVLLKRYGHHLPFVRNLKFHPLLKGHSFKAFILKLMTQGLSPLLTEHAIPHNAHFMGVYDLKPTTDFKALIEEWFKLAKDNTLIMCHPGLASFDKTDGIKATRVKEFNVLSSDDFYPYTSRLWI